MSFSGLQAGDLFFQENQKLPGTVALVDGKVQYHVVKKGKGKSIAAYNRPLISYYGKYLQGGSIPQTEMRLDLDETYPGLKKGLVGMKEGEVRVFYLHPEWGDGKGVMMLEVEVIQVD